MKEKTHLVSGTYQGMFPNLIHRRYACGVIGPIYSTFNRGKVTCKNCRRTKFYKRK